MADLVSDGGEFSCNFCTSKLKLTVIQSSSTGDSKKLANQTNCMFPPPGGNCTFPPGVPPTPCSGIPPGCVIATGQSTVKIDGQTALGDGCKFLCPKGQPVTLSKAGQTIAKHDEASAGVGAYIAGGCLIVGGVVLAIALLPEEAVVGAAIVAKAVAKIGAKQIKKIAEKTKKLFRKSPKTNPQLFKNEKDFLSKCKDHVKDRAKERNISVKDMMDAGNKPLKIGDPVVDTLGRTSTKYIGKNATIVVNPKGEVITCYKTSSKIAEKLIQGN